MQIRVLGSQGRVGAQSFQAGRLEHGPTVEGMVESTLVSYAAVAVLVRPTRDSLSKLPLPTECVAQIEIVHAQASQRRGQLPPHDLPDGELAQVEHREAEELAEVGNPALLMPAAGQGAVRERVP